MTGTSPVHLKMNPVWVSFGDYDNILFQTSLMSTGISDDKSYVPIPIIDESKELFAKALSIGNFPIHLKDEDYLVNEDEWSDDIDRVYCDAYKDKIRFDLQVAKTGNLDLKDLTESVLGKTGERSKIIPMSGIILPGDGNPVQQHKYFHVDRSNKTCFNVEEAKLMCEYIEYTDFINRVKKQLNHIDFQLPQVFESNEHNFCNEDVYGTFNFVLVTGIVSPLI
jgi:hypothetical protein